MTKLRCIQRNNLSPLRTTSLNSAQPDSGWLSRGLLNLPLLALLLLACNWLAVAAALAGENSSPDQVRTLAKELQALATSRDDFFVTQDQRVAAVSNDIKRRRAAANAQDRQAWAQIQSLEDWQRFLAPRLAAFKNSLGTFPDPPENLLVKKTGTLQGDGYRVEKLLFQSRVGQWVPGHLYVPAADAKTPRTRPGILIAHSHHRDKLQGELQDMGMTWARGGCIVLVIDQVGYGERRAHPFDGPEDYPQEYRYWRQDYYYRYDSGIQLQLIGDSLMGWMVWDLRRGIDLLSARGDVDPDKIILLGSVAGGGDPAAATAALDERVDACVPLNFGGPQPETQYPLPEKAEVSFDYLGGSYWDSTRGLRLSGSQGFFHWVIVGSIAPRRLIYAHEFAWDQQRDPVWKRLQTIYGQFYHAPESIAFAFGKGSVRGRPPTSTHCTNIGAYHRQQIHPQFRRWFDLQVTSQDEFRHRRDSNELICLTPHARRLLRPHSLLQLTRDLGRKRAQVVWKQLQGMSPDKRVKLLQEKWRKLLGTTTHPSAPKVHQSVDPIVLNNSVEVTPIELSVQPGISVPLLVFSPRSGHPTPSQRSPVVVAVAQGGRVGLLQHRSEQIAQLLSSGVMVCVAEVRNTGSTKSKVGRWRTSGDTNRSVNLQLFGETVLGGQLADLRSILAYLRTRADVDPGRLAIWGDSFVQPNPPEINLNVPHGVSGRPPTSEPVGGLLALLAALYETQPDTHSSQASTDSLKSLQRSGGFGPAIRASVGRPGSKTDLRLSKIQAVCISGGLTQYQDVLADPHVLIPHDAAVPGAIAAGDLPALALVAGCPVHLAGMVDGSNRSLSAEQVQKLCSMVGLPQKHLSFSDQRVRPAHWLTQQLAPQKRSTR